MIHRIKKNLILVRHIYNTIAVKTLSLFLPRECYIQELPDRLFEDNGAYYRKAQRRFNSGFGWTLADSNRVAMFILLLERVRHLDGELAELGTHRGGTARLMYKYKNQKETLYCFDTFEGFDEKDVAFESTIGVKTKKGHFSNTSIDTVTREVTDGKTNSETLKLVKGYFPDTFKGHENIKWKFVHLDADLYNPIKAGLEHFYPNIVRGGVMLVHDYNGNYVGTKKAVDEFASKNNITVVPLFDKVGSALIIKN